MGHHRRGFQKGVVQDLGEERTTFVGITHHHVHHFVVPGVAQRLVEDPIGERRTQNQRVDLPPDIELVGGFPAFGHLRDRAFEALHHRPDFFKYAFFQLRNDFPLQGRAVHGVGCADAKIDLLQPALHSDEQVLHVRNRKLERGVNLVRPLPVLDEGVELVGKGFPPFPIGKEIDVQPGIAQCRLADQENSCVHESRNHRLALIHYPISYTNPEIS